MNVYLHRLLNNTQIFVFWMERKKAMRLRQREKNNNIYENEEKNGNERMGQIYNALIKALKSP